MFSFIAVEDEPLIRNVSVDIAAPGASLGVAGTEASKRLKLNAGMGGSSWATRVFNTRKEMRKPTHQ